MHSHLSVRERSGSRDGVALVLVLACIVLIAILIVSFISFSRLNQISTASYSKSILAQEIAQGGLQDILGDLHAEIVAGSTAYNTNSSGVAYVNSYATAYIPTTNFTAVPARIGYPSTNWGTDITTTNFAPTLVRVSRSSQDGTPTDVYPAYNATYYPGTVPLNRASAASTTNSFNGGRYISTARWNKSYLLAANSASVPTPFVTSPPDWVYVTRTGSRVCSATELSSLKPSSNLAQSYTITAGANPPASPVVGRYAFVIYDEGALLDINAAGSPSSLITGSAPVLPPPSYTNNITGGIYTLPGKSYVTSSDLTQLPGLSGAQTTAVDPLINWRHAGSITSIGSTGSNFLQIMLNYGSTGFLSFSTGDNPILGRQDLINYFANIDTNINTSSATYAKALPYLGTFSRAFNAPSWSPTLDSSSLPGYVGGTATSVVKYKTNKEGTGIANRDLANVRFSAAGTIQHYNDAGVATSYTVSAGDPLLQYRFSLAKLAWIGHSGASGSVSAAAIQSCFGLSWNATALRWDYYGSTGSAAVGSIETLDQVATENREPNFFELLKAGILSGSLGKNPGAATANPSFIESPYKVEGPLGYDFDSYSSNSDFQIIQIGVNIIDQSRTDNYPTAIYLNFTPPRTYTSEGPLFQTAFGIKNLPYLTRIGIITAITAGPANAGSAPPYDTVSSWLQPELWNPHQNPYATYPGTVAPTQLRLVTFGECYPLNTVDAQGTAPQNPGNPIIFGDNPSSPATAGEIFFSNSSAFFNNPVPLTDTYAGSTTNPPQNVWPTTASGCLVDFSNSGGKNQFYAVFTGSVQRVPPVAVTGTANRVRVIPDPQLTFVLQYFDGTNWLPYAAMSRIAYIGTQSFASANSNGNAAWKEFAARPDPRTDRFSVSEGEAQGGPQPSYWPMTVSSKGVTVQWDNITSANNYGSFRSGFPLISAGFVYSPTVSPAATESPTENEYVNMWAQNQASPSVANPNNSNAYYPDPDGVVRPGDSFRENLASGAGVMLNASTNPSGVTASTASGRRPVILNRPFRSVGELGNVFRDLPFKTLDFWSNSSADAALLDLFSVTDEPQIVAGQVNPNNAPVPVLQALILGGMKNESLTPNLTISGTDTQTMATSIANQINVLPLRNRADLVPALSSAITANLTTNIPELGNKTYGETSLRALSSVTNTRTWNLLIDIIAQSGQMSATAATLNDFIVQGERRYWLHIAIDRYTGKIVDQQLEPVYE